MTIPIAGFTQTHFDGKRFVNPFPTFQERTRFDLFRWLVWDRITGKRPAEKGENVLFSAAKTKVMWLKKNRDRFSVTWIGHSTLLIQLDGMNILTDPIFSKRSSPFSFIGPKRLVPPGIPLDSLPSIDLVVISHDHYDHLDKKTIKFLGNKPFYLVPLGVGNILKSWGITRYAEKDWGDETEINGLKIICTPAQHFSGRSLFGQNSTLWVSWLLQGQNVTFYFGGDTGYFSGFSEIGRQYGPIHFAALPIGAYAPRWFMKSVHMNPEEALTAFKELKAREFIPIHWGTFRLTDEPMAEPMERLIKKAEERSLEKRIRIFKHGETKMPHGEAEL